MTTTQDEPSFARFATGYMGDPTQWCYWDAEYNEEGSVGPFASKAEALEHAMTIGYVEEPTS